MNYIHLNEEPKELMSESLQNVLQTNEQQIEEIRNIFILACLTFNNDVDELLGNILGIEFGNNPKIDMNVSTEKAFKFIAKQLSLPKNVESILLIHDAVAIKIPGPFKINNLKIVEMDYENRACVLAIDLFKDHP